MKMRHLRRLPILAVIFMLAFNSACASIFPTPTSTPTPTATPTPLGYRPGWNLVWHDEFDGPQLDTTKWSFDKGSSGWGNAELEDYTDRTENVRTENGHLVIEARKESYAGTQYTSGRIKTYRLGEWTYGRFEGRLQIPRGQGIWPAFWMMGSSGGGWPYNGEIDIMENIGKEPNRIHGTVHGPGYSGAKGPTSPFDLASGAFADDYHVFAVEWEPQEIRWYMDDQLYKTLTPKDIGDNTWVFDHPFYLIMNVAVGGGWPGYPNETSTFPQQMLVDYVRVYQK